MSRNDIHLAALWLRRQAELVGARQAEAFLDRRHKPRREVALPRDMKGRWTHADVRPQGRH